MTTRTTDVQRLLTETAWLQRLARSLVRGRDTADDVVQETLLRAMATPSASLRNLRAWLAVVARHVARRFARDEVRERRRLARLETRELEPAVAETVERTEAQRRVMAALLALEEPYRAVLLLRFQGGLGYAAIALQLGVPVETVRTRIKRGLQRLREQLDERHGRAAWAAPLLLRAPATAVWLAAAAGVLALAGFVVRAMSERMPAPNVGVIAAVGPVEPVEPRAAVAELASRMPELPRAAAGPAPGEGSAATSATPAGAAPPMPSMQAVMCGRVVDTDTGAPVAAAEVAFERRFVRVVGADGAAEPVRRTWTDAAGCFELPFEHSGTAGVISVSAVGHDRVQLFPDNYVPKLPLQGARRDVMLDLGDIGVGAATVLSGRVRHADGRPVAAAEVMLLSWDRTRGLAERAAITDAHGAFVLVGLPRVDGCEAWIAACAGEHFAIALLPTAGTVELRCLPTATMCVRAVDETGAPIAEASVLAECRSSPTHDGTTRIVDGPWPRQLRRATSDRDGNAMLASFPVSATNGECVLTVVADGHRGERRTQPLAPGHNVVDVVLPRGASGVVRGVVVDAATQLPIVGAVVDGSARSGDDGTFGIADLDLARGTVRLAATASGYADACVEEPVGGRFDPLFVRVEMHFVGDRVNAAPRGATVSFPLTGGAVQLPEVISTPRRAR